MPQGSILGPLLFNIYLSDLFLFIGDCCNIANYADDNTPYAFGKDINSVISQLEDDSLKLFHWLWNNILKANPNKSHLLLNSCDTSIVASINGNSISNESYVELLGITIDNELNFNKHVSGLCVQASKKLHALSRMPTFMSIDKRRLIMKSFFLSQCSYCPLVWIFHSRELNNRINRLHERSLRVVYRDNLSSFEELLFRDKSFTIHERNIQHLAIELFKAKNGLSSKFISEIFCLKENRLYGPKQHTLSIMGRKLYLFLVLKFGY